MFWNATTCQKRKIFAGKSIKNDNMAPVSGLLLRRKLAQGPFFFCIWGEAKRSDDAGKRHNHRAKALVFRGLGAEPTNKLLQFGPDCTACHYYPEWCANAPALKNKRFEGIL